MLVSRKCLKAIAISLSVLLLATVGFFLAAKPEWHESILYFQTHVYPKLTQDEINDARISLFWPDMDRVVTLSLESVDTTVALEAIQRQLPRPIPFAVAGDPEIPFTITVTGMRVRELLGWYCAIGNFTLVVEKERVVLVGDHALLRDARPVERFKGEIPAAEVPSKKQKPEGEIISGPDLW